MKNLLKTIGIIVLIAVIVTTIASCGGGGSSPQSLAKQTWAEFEKVCKAEGVEANGLAYFGWAMKMAQEPSPAFTKIMEKVVKLSAEDKKIYEEEFMKISGLGN